MQTLLATGGATNVVGIGGVLAVERVDYLFADIDRGMACSPGPVDDGFCKAERQHVCLNEKYTVFAGSS